VLLLVLTALLGWGWAAWFFSALLVAAAGLAGAVVVLRRSRAGGAYVARATLRGAVPAVVGVLVCAFALALPDALRKHENGAMVAWSAPGEDSVVLAEHGVALTLGSPSGDEDDTENVVVGRDLDDGHVRWRTRVPVPADAERGSYDGRWQRVGDVALVAGGPFRHAALDLRTGRVRWSAPVAPQAAYLGAPTMQRTPESGPLWPGRWVLTMAPDPQQGDAGPSFGDTSRAPERPLSWAVRDLETGRVVRRGTTRGLSGLALAGGGLLRERELEGPTGVTRPRTTWSLVDPETGRVRWSRTEEAGRSDPGGPGLGIWLPSGRIPLARSPFAGFDLNVEDRYARGGGRELRLIDPRTGRDAGVPLGSSDHLTIETRPAAPVTAATVARNPDPDATLLLNVIESGDRYSRELVAFPGRPGAPRSWPDRTASDDYVFTATLAARPRSYDLEDLTGEGQQDGIEIRDLRTGEVVNRIRGWGAGYPEAVGERIVFHDRSGDEDGPGVTRVLRARP
jgi:hypothetical protein